MRTDTDDSINRLFDTLLQRFQQALVTSSDRRSGLAHKNVVLSYYYFQKIDIQRAESYKMSSEWIVTTEATINLKNEKGAFTIQ